MRIWGVDEGQDRWKREGVWEQKEKTIQEKYERG